MVPVSAADNLRFSGADPSNSAEIGVLSPEELACLDGLCYNEQGLIPAIVQDYLDGTVLMMAWMNRGSLQKTLETGRTWFWSRSRQAFWAKGEISGHVQWVKQIHYDCDSDALLITVEQVGDVACHTGARSCFFRPLLKSASNIPSAADTLSQVFAVIKARQADPSSNSYTSNLLAKGDNAILKKLGEETAEVVMAVKDQEPTAIASEVADLWYHCLVALAHHQVDIKDVYRQLQARRSGK
ncbi:bifunctional phosphoribosyl-AMP cyclohydrolase/phosphoribosyl-ATP diphosphatase HisIE [Synechococcus sp. Nb3U1]|nr:bifunctional phosphoribosyl-AMP cyclohydrolase/phosphoribosyl-ATP diphosphatase HisIE [Synechococcus sp. Nb3U1]MCF2969887.1 bifunctional phosphoribosyl-AMP cyclohydrolase/phosphoribosyl-ATP diphosphatase HisIE [Synechococcus sp. Nb3U1]